jgi:phage shock protein C
MQSRRLERSTTNRVISGVCGGLAEYLAIDAGIVRAFFVIATIITAFLFLLVYIVLLILMPLPGQRAPIDDLWPGARTTPPSGTSAEAAAAATEGAVTPPPAPRPEDPAEAERRRNLFGWAIVVIGAIFLLSNLGAFRFVEWKVIWPLVLIGIGVLVLAQRSRS